MLRIRQSVREDRFSFAAHLGAIALLVTAILLMRGVL